MIAGLFVAAKRYLYTVAVVSNPLGWMRLPFRLNRKANRSRFVPPLVFLSVGSFLLARIVDLLLVWFFDDPKGTLMSFIRVEQVSIASLVLKMLPLIVFAFIANWLVALLVTRGVQKQEQMFRFLCYLFGFYGTAWFFLFLVNATVLLLQKNPGGWFGTAPVETARLVLASIGVVYVVLSPLCLAFIGSWQLNRHRSAWLKLLNSTVAAVLFLAVMVGAVAIQSIRADQKDEQKTAAKPVHECV